MPIHLPPLSFFAGVGAPRWPLALVFMQQVRLQGILVGPRDAFETMSRTIAQNGVRPVVDHTFAFEEVPAAFELMAAGRHFGKICVRV